MNDSHRLETIATHNARSLKTLARAISMGKGKFSLIVVRCNYEILQEDILQLLRQQCPRNIADFWVPRSAISLYTTIQENFGDKSTDALVLFGLESVNKLDLILESANRLRDEFRNLSFPLVLWLTDVGLKKLMQQAPDFNSFGSVPIYFTLPDEELKALICQRVDAAVNDAANFYMNPAEIEALQQDIASRNYGFDPETRAGLTFLLGWDLARNQRIDAAIAKYQDCLQFWQESDRLEKQGLLLLNLGLAYQTKDDDDWQQARDYLQESLDKFDEASRDDLVSKYISYLGQILKKLHQWPELKKLANRALKMHKIQGQNRQLARDYGWLAEVAFQESRYQEAEQLAGNAWEIADANIAVKERAFYGFILGRSLAELGKLPKAIAILEQASRDLENARQTMGLNLPSRSRSKRVLSDNPPNPPFEGVLSEYDPELHVEILKQLRNWQSQQKQYREAFQNKLLQTKIETQYGWRAFLGAGRLQPPVINFAGITAAEKSEIYRQIAAALGREVDINRLIEKIKNPQYKITIIYGQSGVGKSSILQAGLIPALQLTYFEGRDYLPISVRVYKDWVQSLAQELIESDGGPPDLRGAQPESDGGPLLNNEGDRIKVPLTKGDLGGLNQPMNPSPELILSQLRENEHRRLFTILIFDQFEEFFFDNPDPSMQAEFYRFLQECLTVPYLKVVLSLREDYLYYLLEFSRNYPLKNVQQPYEEMLYYLGNFERKDAEKAIRSLTERSQITLESDLLEEFVADLAKQFNGVRPIELQVVGAQLETEEITTLDQYRQLGENPKQVLVEKFLAAAVKDCGEENHKVAELVLYLLTNAQNTRPLKTIGQLTEDLKIEQKQLDLVLEVLVGSGLVLLLPEKPENFYQLVHDYLVPFVRQKYEPQLLALRKQQKKIRQLEIDKRALEAKRQVEKRFYFKLRLALVATGVFAVFAIIFGVKAYRESLVAMKESIIAYANQSLLMLSDRPFDAQLAAVKVGSKLLKNELSATERFLVVTDSLRQAVYKQEGEWFREYNRLVGHDDWVYGLSFSPDGKLIATAGWDKQVKLWGLDGKFKQDLKGHQDLVRDVSFSPDGKLIATASFDKKVKLWRYDGQEWQILQALAGHNEPVIAVSFSPDGELIATASKDNTVKLWRHDGKEWKIVQTLAGEEGHFAPVYGVSFSPPDGKLIATASFDNTVKLWGLDGKEWKILQTLTEHEKSVYSVSFSPDGKLIASASEDNKVKLWRRDGKEWKILQTLTGHQQTVIDVSFSRDGKLIASVSGDNTVKLWHHDDKEWKILQTFTGHKDWVNAVSFSPDGELIASASDDKTVKLWRRVGKELQILKGHQDWVNAISFTDKELIATASDDKTVKLWHHNGQEWQILQTLKGHEDSVNALSISFSPDGKSIAAASYDNTVKLWSRDGRLLQTLAGHEELVRDVSFSPDGKLIATASWDKTVKLWDYDGQEWQILQTLAGHNEAVIAVSFSPPDGKLIASASRDNTVKLWNRDGTLLQTLTGHEGPVYGVSFSPPDGELIATASWDKTVKLWRYDGERYKFEKTLTEDEDWTTHKDKVYDVSFSPDEKLIATASWDKTVKLWNTDGKLLQTFTGHSGPVNSVSFSDDGKMLASASGDNTVIVWDVWDFDDLMRINCQWVGDYLRNSAEVEESDRLLCDEFLD